MTSKENMQQLLAGDEQLARWREIVAQTIDEERLLSEKLIELEETNPSFSNKIADKVATFGGSWKFIGTFGAFLLMWIVVNVFWLKNHSFDPFPFILLNLLLSCLAALQAPFIMMSQNRQEEKDRERAKKDYMINLKSELEIRILHEKIDHLMIHQQHELIQIQKIQIEMMQDILERVNGRKQ